jgi:DNA-directed RNA polymerase specialized sigma24 family protein/CheY-like chemotaxis protein
MATERDRNDSNGTGLDQIVATHLPYLRRYARALTGAQDAGDRYAIATLEAIIADPSTMDGHDSPKTGLFAVFHRIWSSSGAVVEDAEAPDSLLEQRAQWRLQGLSPNSREALLLNTIEGFTLDAIGTILDVSRAEAGELLERAREEMGKMVTGDVLIIEDEAIIAMDLEAIVGGMGHTVVDIARTRAGAVKLGTKHRPDLILADIQLADKSSGIDAVNDLLATLGDVPVIFITAFPERLLTGERPEPAFLISKPYKEEQVRAAVSQAMFFASTESLLQAG